MKRKKKMKKEKKISNLARKITREFYNLQKKAPTSKIYINIALINENYDFYKYILNYKGKEQK